LPGIFSDHMVLQRDIPIHIWGWADPGERVSVRLGETASFAVTDGLGHWSLYLPPQRPGDPVTVKIEGTNSITLSDVLIGDVWVASGQSNMMMPLAGFPGAPVRNSELEIAHAAHPEMRLLTVPPRSSQFRMDDVSAAWKVCMPDSAKDFSAVAYFFGREISSQEKIPVGLIDATAGGTPAESWMSLQALASDSSLAPILVRWGDYEDEEVDVPATKARDARVDAEAKTAGKPVPQHTWHPELGWWAPSGFFNGMIAPITPFTIKGVIWYQGETSSSAERAPFYERLFPDLIANWRSEWKQGNFPFLYAQIAGLDDSEKIYTCWGVIRDAQRRALSVANTGMAVTLDVGESNNIHPTDKLTVGHRLAVLAGSLAYGENIEAYGPLFERAMVEGGSVRVWFEHAAGLTPSSGGAVEGFEVAGKDHSFRPAEAHIDGSSIVVSSAEIKSPLYVRYAWAIAPVANLVNSTGLPASTFTSEGRLSDVFLLPTAH
jgi:sialate O-acetylesterase